MTEQVTITWEVGHEYIDLEFATQWADGTEQRGMTHRYAVAKNLVEDEDFDLYPMLTRAYTESLATYCEKQGWVAPIWLRA